MRNSTPILTPESPSYSGPTACTPPAAPSGSSPAGHTAGPRSGHSRGVGSALERQRFLGTTFRTGCSNLADHWVLAPCTTRCSPSLCRSRCRRSCQRLSRGQLRNRRSSTRGSRFLRVALWSAGCWEGEDSLVMDLPATSREVGWLSGEG